jgi:CheY-like chemotaxis protein
MSATRKPLMILMAEDDNGHATLIRRNLARAGVANEIVHVSDGQQALDYLFRRAEYADRPKDANILLLLDINMPRIDGFEVLRQLKANPATARTPVIMLTTTDDPRDVARGYELGCSVYIPKPVQYEAFVEAMRRLGLFLENIQVPATNGVTP